MKLLAKLLIGMRRHRFGLKRHFWFFCITEVARTNKINSSFPINKKINNEVLYEIK